MPVKPWPLLTAPPSVDGDGAGNVRVFQYGVAAIRLTPEAALSLSERLADVAWSALGDCDITLTEGCAK